MTVMLEAHEPAELRGSGRDDVRLLVSDRATGAVTHAHFRHLPEFLKPGDLLVLNTSATLPAALTAIRDNGDAIALHWSTPLPGGLAVVEPRQALTPPSPALSRSAGEGGAERWVRAGETLTLPGDGRATLLAPYRDSKRLWIAQLDLSGSLEAGIDLPIVEYLRRWGRPITYSYIDRRFP